MVKETLVILYGGRSAEREVSVMSATNVVRSVDYDRFKVKTVFITKKGDFVRGESFESTPEAGLKLMDNSTVKLDKKIGASDIVEAGAVYFPMLHGPMGEDGTIQGFLEVLGVPYAGPSVLSAATTMDKIVSKEIFAEEDIPQLPYVAITDGHYTEATIDQINQELTYPLFVKPANMGSSVGISKVDSRAHLTDALDEALKYDNRVVIEQGLVIPHEVECAALGNDEVEITLPGEVVNSGTFYDYDEKYLNNALTIEVPAKLPPEIVEEIRTYAAKAYKAMAGRGLARCDFFVDHEGHVYLNEINAIPGFTAFSMYPMLWENMGLPQKDLISRLVDLGKEAYALKEEHLAY